MCSLKDNYIMELWIVKSWEDDIFNAAYDKKDRHASAMVTIIAISYTLRINYIQLSLGITLFLIGNSTFPTGKLLFIILNFYIESFFKKVDIITHLKGDMH